MPTTSSFDYFRSQTNTNQGSVIGSLGASHCPQALS